jgi:hypothetical protein
MAVITLPEKFAFTSIKNFALQRSSNTIRSKYTGVRSTVSYPYAIWILEGELVSYDGPEAAAIRSFLVQLEGQKNKFKLPVPGFSELQIPYVDGSTTYNVRCDLTTLARSTSMNIRNLNPNVQIFTDGDFITIQDELKVVVGDHFSDSNGNLVLTFQPPLRKEVSRNTIIQLSNPYCLMHGQDDDVANWGLSAPIRHKIKFEAIEAIEA